MKNFLIFCSTCLFFQNVIPGSLMPEIVSEKKLEKRAVGVSKEVDDINAQDSAGYTALHKAVKNENKDLVYSLLVQGADRNIKTSLGYTALHFAAINNNKAIAQYLLSTDPSFGLPINMNAQNKYGETALCLAVKNVSLSVAKTLLDLGANVNIVDKKGNTVLHEAVSRNLYEIAVILSTEGKADTSIKNKEEKTPIDFIPADEIFSDSYDIELLSDCRSVQNKVIGIKDRHKMRMLLTTGHRVK